jgi:hypothetical protein
MMGLPLLIELQKYSFKVNKRKYGCTLAVMDRMGLRQRVVLHSIDLLGDATHRQCCVGWHPIVVEN